MPDVHQNGKMIYSIVVARRSRSSKMVSIFPAHLCGAHPDYPRDSRWGNALPAPA